MTVIAYRDGVMAADSRMAAGAAIMGNMTKIVRHKNGDLCGAAGRSIYAVAFREWFLGLREKMPEARVDNEGLDRGLIVRRGGKIEVYEYDSFYTVDAAYFAIGSGANEARGAMFVGADAAKAVEAAIAHDSNCAAPITVLTHD